VVQVAQVSPIASLVHHCSIAVAVVVVCGVALVAQVAQALVVQATLVVSVLMHHLLIGVQVVAVAQMRTGAVATVVLV
jgi:hypothetical protein